MADNYLSAHDAQRKRNDGPRLDIPSRRRLFCRPSSANAVLDRELRCTLVQEEDRTVLELRRLQKFEASANWEKGLDGDADAAAQFEARTICENAQYNC
jgi:hypothetical protein